MLVLIPSWDFEEGEMSARHYKTPQEADQIRKAALHTLRDFFELYQIKGAEFTRIDVGTMCQDATILYFCRQPGIRMTEPLEDPDIFADCFQNETPIPKDYKPKVSLESTWILCREVWKLTNSFLF